MSNKNFFLLTIVACPILTTCGEKSSDRTTTRDTEQQGTSVRQGKANDRQLLNDDSNSAASNGFIGQTFHSLDGNNAISIRTENELEIKTNNAILVGKYTKNGDRIRIVIIAMGTERVLYLTISTDKLLTEDGGIYYSKAAYDNEISRIKRALELVEAATNGQSERMMELLDAGVSINTVAQGDGSNAGADLMTLAIGSGKPSAVKCLIERGWPTNLCNNRGKGLLNVCISAKDPSEEIIKLLLDSGADPNRVLNPQDAQPLWLLIRNCSWSEESRNAKMLSLINLLLKHGANPNWCPDRDAPALAHVNDWPDAVYLLMDAGADKHAICWGKKSVLECASLDHRYYRKLTALRTKAERIEAERIGNEYAKRLVGKWSFEENPDFDIYRPDGTGEFDSTGRKRQIKWKIDGDLLIIWGGSSYPEGAWKISEFSENKIVLKTAFDSSKLTNDTQTGKRAK